MKDGHNWADVGDFVTITDSSFATHGVKKDDLLYVAGDTVVSVDEADPYELRRLLICAYTEGGHVLAEKQPFMVDGKRLEKVSKVKQERYKAMMEIDFAIEEAEDETTH